jgi:hypothetical protein
VSHAVRPRSPLVALCLCALPLLSTGCSLRSARPDAEVARIVEREERRERRLAAQRAALAEADFENLDLTRAAALIDAIALLAVDYRARADATPTPADPPLGAAAGWRYDAPAGWTVSTAPLSMQWDKSLWDHPATRHLRAGDGDDDGSASAGPWEMQQNDRGRPQIFLNFLRMRINNLPVSFSGSLRKSKGLQLRATVKM